MSDISISNDSVEITIKFKVSDLSEALIDEAAEELKNRFFPVFKEIELSSDVYFYGGKKYIGVPSDHSITNWCLGCAFYKNDLACQDMRRPPCSGTHRRGGTDIIWKEAAI